MLNQLGLVFLTKVKVRPLSFTFQSTQKIKVHSEGTLRTRNSSKLVQFSLILVIDNKIGSNSRNSRLLVMSVWLLIVKTVPSDQRQNWRLQEWINSKNDYEERLRRTQLARLPFPRVKDKSNPQDLYNIVKFKARFHMFEGCLPYTYIYTYI